MKCPYCGSQRIEQSVAWGKSSETGNVGLKYGVGSGLFSLTGVAQVYPHLYKRGDKQRLEPRARKHRKLIKNKKTPRKCFETFAGCSYLAYKI